VTNADMEILNRLFYFSANLRWVCCEPGPVILRPQWRWQVLWPKDQ